MTLDLRFYVSRFLRRLHYFLAIALAVTALGVTLAWVLPPVYRAQARLLVESPQIPGALAASTVQAGAPELLQIIQQRLLTRANLLEMARRFDIYADRPGLDADQVVRDMRRRTSISLPDGGDAAAFVTVSFAAPDAALSAQVTNEFVTAILQESVTLRTATSGQTLDFFEQEVARLNEDLARQGARILEFKLEHKDALPDSLDYRRGRQASQQERLLQIEREMAGLRDRRGRLVELYERTGRVDSAVEARTPEQRQLQELRDRLSTALVIYSPQNPQVKMLQAQVSALEEVVAAQVGVTGVEGATLLSPFEVQLADVDAQISFMAEQKELIEDELAALKLSIDATPGNAITLDTLQRDYDNIQLQYNTAVDRLSAAATGDRIEALSKGQRISVIENAAVPLNPDSPKRKLIAAAGAAAGVGLGAAAVALMEFLNRAVLRPADLASRLGIAPFATIPYMRTRRETFRRRAAIALGLLAVLVGIPAALFALHVFYLPLDLLVDRLLERIGLGRA